MSTDERRFFVKSPAHVQHLELWLSDRRFNYHYPYLKDSKDNRMIGLSFRDGTSTTNSGAIVVCKDELFDAVLDVVKMRQERRGE
jgi:hypothetical protein